MGISAESKCKCIREMMKNFRYLRSGLLLCCLFSGPVIAADYPYTGAYTIGDKTPDSARWRKAACLTHFLTQTASGKYALFHLDPRALMQLNELRYVVYETGQCTHNSKDNIDSCEVHYSYRNALEPYFIRYENRRFNDTRIVIGESRAALSPLNTQRFGSTSLLQVKCPLTVKQLAPFITRKRTTYPKADVQILTGLFGLAPLLEFHKRVRAILAKQGLQDTE